MCDISTLIIFWALSPIPGFRYIGLGLVVTSFIIYAANCQRPSYKLSQLEDMIKITEEMLKRAREKCARDHVELTHEARRLLEAKLTASKIQSRLLKTRNDTTWKKYLQSLRGIMQSIDECAKKVKKIQTSTLLTIQTEHQRQLSEGIKEFREVANAVICSSTREGRTHMATRRRRFESEPTIDVLDESEIYPGPGPFAWIESARRAGGELGHCGSDLRISSSRLKGCTATCANVVRPDLRQKTFGKP
ncbi:hypothetical protein B0H13DRAFT_1920676 [Mycena leptocephala]|nr:hypothetical protein B0H13DRAFT_1920676 [Mycena leptocephala]